MPRFSLGPNADLPDEICFVLRENSTYERRSAAGGRDGPLAELQDLPACVMNDENRGEAGR